LTRAITNAIARGVVFVTITHNDSSNRIRFPGNLTNCITVGATDQQDQRATFSNYGPEIDLAAPGQSIATVSTGGGLNYWNGTSFSAPLVSGVAALLCSLRPSLTHHQIADLLCAGADDRVGGTTDTNGFDVYFGWGRLNAYNTLLLAQTSPRVTTTNGEIVLNWRSPSNASNRQPYRVVYAPTASGPWTTADLTNFTYTSSNTTWRSALTASNQFVRIQIRP
jgi:subtilisin family serine protease